MWTNLHTVQTLSKLILPKLQRFLYTSSDVRDEPLLLETHWRRPPFQNWKITVSYVRLLLGWHPSIVLRRYHIKELNTYSCDDWSQRLESVLINHDHQLHWNSISTLTDTRKKYTDTQTSEHTDSRHWRKKHPFLNGRLTTRISDKVHVASQVIVTTTHRVTRALLTRPSIPSTALKIFSWQIPTSIQLYHVRFFPLSRPSLQVVVKRSIRSSTWLLSLVPPCSSPISFFFRLPLSHIRCQLCSPLSPSVLFQLQLDASTSPLTPISFRVRFLSFPLHHPRPSCSPFLFSLSSHSFSKTIFLIVSIPLRGIVPPQYPQRSKYMISFVFLIVSCYTKGLDFKLIFIWWSITWNNM